MNTLYCSESRIETLKKRKKRCVCKYCGGQLEIKRIIFSDIEDARIELYCENCERIEFGVEPEIYQSANNFVDNLEFDLYESMDDNEKKHQMNVAKVSEILAWGFQNTGLLTADGFNVSLEMNNENWTECMILSEDQISFVSENEAEGDIPC